MDGGDGGRTRGGGVGAQDLAGLLRLYEQMVLLRRFESAAQIACRKGETPGFLHLYIGEEATAVGVCAHLTPSDWITSTHRGHGHALAKGMDPQRPDGRAVRQARRLLRRPRRHHASLRPRRSACSAPTASSRPASAMRVGVGISARIAQGRTTSASPSSATARSTMAAFHEALNFAGVQQARRWCFVCENNLYATATPLTHGDAQYRDRHARPPPTAFPGVAVDGNDVVAVWQAMRGRRRRGRARGEGPDADRGEDLPHRRPPRGRPGDRHLPDAGGGRRLGEALTRSRPSARGSSRSSTSSTRAELDDDRARAIDDGRRRTRSTSRGTRPSPIPSTVARPRLRRAAQPAGGAGGPPRPGGTVDDGLARRGARRHRRGDAARIRTSSISARAPASAAAPSRIPRASGRSSAPTRMVDTPISEQGFTGAAIGASATGTRVDRRPDVRRFHVRGGRADRAAGGEAALHVERPDERADGGARRRRRGAQRRPASQRHVSSDVGACARPDRLPAVDAGRRQGPDEDGAAGAAIRCIMLETEGAVRHQGRGARGRAFRAVRRRPDRARRRATSPSSPAGQLVHRALEAAETLAARGHRVSR